MRGLFLVCLVFFSAGVWGAETVPFDEDTPLPDLDMPPPFADNPVRKEYCVVWIDMLLSASAEATVANVGVRNVKGSADDERIAKEALIKAVEDDNFAHPNLLMFIKVQSDETNGYTPYQYEAIYHEGCKLPED